MALRRYIVYLSLALAIAAGLATALPVVAGTGRGILAALFMGATGAAVGAHATSSKSAPEAPPGKPLPAGGQNDGAKNAAEKKAEQTEADQRAAARTKAAKESAAEEKDVRTYLVRAGDSLSKIAAEQNVSGSWQELYADNRKAIGADPSLIRPGLKLVIGGKEDGATGSKSSSVAFTSRSESSPEDSSADKPSETKRARTVTPKSSSTAPSWRSESSSKDSSADMSSTSAKTAGTVNGFSAPVSGVALGTGYQAGGNLWSSGHHTGVDFLAPAGTPVKAVGAGTVVSAGWGGAYGNQVIIHLADGHYAQYAHLSSFEVSSGQTVTAGQQIGLSGATGNVTGPHLHFEIRTTPDYGSDIDPVAYLNSKGLSIG